MRSSIKFDVALAQIFPAGTKIVTWPKEGKGNLRATAVVEKTAKEPSGTKEARHRKRKPASS